MTLNIMPECSEPTVTTTGSVGATSRLATVCSSPTSADAPTIGSTAFSASRHVRPSDQLDVETIDEEKNAPSRTPIFPASSPL